ncbi:MAG: hypothetical protein ACT4NL_00075 [Pseudomarimonas sp.]
MTHVRSATLRLAAAGMAILFLLLPGVMPILAWGRSATLNLEVSMLAIAACILVAKSLPRIKWFVAALASLAIVIPPFPYWLSKFGGVMRIDFSNILSSPPLLKSLFLFLIAMVLFGVIFWALSTKPNNPINRASGADTEAGQV